MECRLNENLPISECFSLSEKYWCYEINSNSSMFNLARNSKNVYLMKNSSRIMQKNTSMAHEKGRMKCM
jgi:hypothetical protein